MAEYMLLQGDSLEVLKELDDNSVDAVVTDPPYGLGKEPDANLVLKDWIEKGYHEIKSKGGFMGKEWDSFVPQPLLWKEVFRVLKPGGHVLSFFGTRTYDWGVMAMRLAGFEIRDCIQWLYGSGFPKSFDISKGIDKRNGRFFDDGFKDYCNEMRKAKGLSLNEVNILMGTATNGGGFASSIMGDKEKNELPTLEMYRKLKVILELDDRYGSLIEMVEAEREVIGINRNGSATGSIVTTGSGNLKREFEVTSSSTDAAKQWDGWGTALKPANEPIVLARKPLIGTVVENVLQHGTGGLNIDGCRVEYEKTTNPATNPLYRAQGGYANKATPDNNSVNFSFRKEEHERVVSKLGRFPANVIMDEVAGAMLDEQTGTLKSGKVSPEGFEGDYSGSVYGKYAKNSIDPNTVYGDSGGASRFFYCAKTSQKERNAGVDVSKFEVSAGHSRNDKCSTCGNYILQADERESKCLCENPVREHAKFKGNHHPTVKPISLMSYLIRLITPPGGTVLDPFNGSGSTGCAAMLENMIYIGIDKEEEYIKISEARIEYYKSQAESKQN